MEGKVDHLGKITREGPHKFNRAGQRTHCPVARSVDHTSTLNSRALNFYDIDLSFVLLVYSESTEFFFRFVFPIPYPDFNCKIKAFL